MVLKHIGLTKKELTFNTQKADFGGQ